MRHSPNPMLFGATLGAAIALVACGGSAVSYRHVDTPTSVVQEYGAPENTEYEMEFAPYDDVLGITVYERSVCPVIQVQVVNRTRETLDGDRVINETPLGKVQIANEVKGQIPCNQQFAREAEVALKIGDAVYPVGETNAEGHVGVNLAKTLNADVYGAPAGEVVVLVRPQGQVAQKEVGRVPLGQLQAREKRIDELVTELGQLLGKAPAEMTPEEIARSYQLYAQLRSIAWYDSRFQGLKLRFWEIWQNRKDLEAAENLGRNLKALDASRELLRSAGPTALPLFVQVGLNSGLVNERMLEWARWELLEGFHKRPEICERRLAWAQMPDYLSVSQQIAGGYMHYAYGDPFERILGDMCEGVQRHR